MARKFKVGDEVEFIGQYGPEPCSIKVGTVGTVKDYYAEPHSLEGTYPYEVDFGGDEIYFNARELKLIRKDK
jgi:hypothetical protein